MRSLKFVIPALVFVVLAAFLMFGLRKDPREIPSPLIGKPVLTMTASPAFTGGVRAQAWDQLKRIIPVQVNIFGDAPWDSYSLLQIVDSSYGGYSGLEHSSSHVDIVAPAFVGSEYQPSLYAHEIFHAWNVKRLRPAELVPYDYSRPPLECTRR